MSNDAPSPPTRWACLLVAAILAAAVALLYVRPGETDELFAWTIAPEITPLFMGAAYGAGAYFFWRGFGTTRWHRISAGFPGIALFATLMLIATLIHWDRFNQGDAPTMAAISFYAWVLVYIASPLLIGGLWLRNRNADDGSPETADAEVPEPVRRTVAVGGGAAMLAAAVFFVAPDVLIEIWPWDLTPLTARVISAFIAEAGAIALVLALDPRWSRWRILTQTSGIGSALLAVALARSWGDLDQGNPLTWALLAAIACTFAGAIALTLRLDGLAKPGEAHA